MRNVKNLILCVLLVWLLATPNSTAFEYEIIDLGICGEAHSINDSGQVVGSYYTASGKEHAFMWTESDGMQDLGTLNLDENWSMAFSINNLGQVVGYSGVASGQAHAFLWTKSDGMKDLGTLGGRNSGARAINDSGQVVGFSDMASGQRHAFLWTESDGMIELSTLGEYWVSIAWGINDFGQVVGSYLTASGQNNAFLWIADGGMKDIGDQGGSGTGAYCINNTGQIVGDSPVEGGRAFLWTADSGLKDLGTLGGSVSSASSINDLGQVVGWSVTGYGQICAFLWTESSGMKDLGVGNRANDINNSGLVVGLRFAAPYGNACMWIPVKPEMMLSGIALFIMDEVDSGNIDPELEGSLLAKVKAAISAIDRGNPSDAKVVMNALKALINQVEAQVDKKITSEAAAEIILRANSVIAAL